MKIRGIYPPPVPGARYPLTCTYISPSPLVIFSIDLTDGTLTCTACRCMAYSQHSSFKLAGFRSLKYIFPAIFLFAGIIFILASPLTVAARLSALIRQIRPSNLKPVSYPPTSFTKPLTTAAMAPQAFRTPPQAPPLFTGTPSSILEDTRRIIEKSRNVEDKIVADVKSDQASFKNVLLPMAYDANEAGLELNILGFYQTVSTDQKLRDASTEADKMTDESGIESSMREDVYKLVDAVLKKEENLDPESQRLLEKSHKEYIQNGLGLPIGPQRDRFKEIKKRLSQISITFQRNLNEEKGGEWLTLEELDGVPDDVITTLEKGEGENAGKLKLTFKYPDYFPALKYAKDPAIRQKIYVDNENKCNQNVPLFKEAILLRDEAARLLGYPNHAAFRIEDKMAKTTETVDDFLGDLRKRLTKGGAEEVKALKLLKEQDLKSLGKEDQLDDYYFLWDHIYYNRLLLEKEYSLDHQKIAEYFPLQSSIRGMLLIFEELFGLTFVEITGSDRASISPTGKGDDIVWHQDVQMFSVWDDEGEGSGFVGYLYLDLHPREGKYVISIQCAERLGSRLIMFLQIRSCCQL